MVPRAARRSRIKVAREALSSSKRQTGTKESPILLSSDDEGKREESVRHPPAANAVPQKRYLGVSPSDPYTFKGHGGAYDVMIAMGYKPDRGLGPKLRGNVRPLSIELRRLRAGVGYHTTSASRSPSPVPLPKKAPVKIIRPPREPVASTSKIELLVKATPQTRSRQKARAQKAAPPSNLLTIPPKSSAPTQKPLSSPTVLSPPPTPVSFAPSDLYLSLMSGLAMANMPQAMQVAAAADPMAAFQLAQMCFAPSPFPLPPFSLAPSQPDHVPGHLLHPHPPNLPPKPVLNSTAKLNNKVTPAPPPPSSTTLPEGNLNHTPPSASASAPDTCTTIETDPQILKQKRLARKINIGWIPEPGFPDRGTFTLVPTTHSIHWSTSEGDTPPDPRRSLVMEDLPGDCRTMEFVRSWADKFPATAVHLNGGPKALIEFPSREVAEVAYDSPRLRGGQFERATHVRVFWYRPQAGDVLSSSTVTANGNAGVTKEVKDAPGDANPEANITTLEEVAPVETTGTGKGARLKGKGKASSLPPPGLDLMDVDLPVRSTTAPTSAQRPSLPLAVDPSTECNQVGRATNGSLEGFERTTSLGSFISLPLCAPPTLPTQVPSPHPCSPSPEIIQGKRTPPGSPPSLRYPSSTPESTAEKSRVPSPGEENSGHDTRSLTSAPDSPTVESSLEQQLRMRLLAMKQSRIANRSCERSASSSTASTVIDPDPDTFSKTTSPPPISATPSSIAISESLELLATSFITDTIQAVQGLPSEPERLDNAIKARLGLKRGSCDAFGSSADIAFKRQRLAQQIEESKRIMEQWKAAKTREERNQIYALWEESNRSVELLSEPVTVPSQWPCYAEGWLVIDSDDEDMDLS